MPTINPPKHIKYNNGKGYVGNLKKPFADIVLVGQQRFSISNVLVDTGADYVQIPQAAAISAGINVGNAVQQPVQTPGGQIILLSLSNVSIEVEGILIQTTVLFHPNGNSRPLLGRSAIHALVNVGFDTSQWLWA